MGIYVISGTVENLFISNSYKYVLCSSDEVKIIRKIRSTAFTVRETTNYIYVNDADSEQDAPAHFGCKVSGQSVIGWFHQVEFSNGDYIDFVVRENSHYKYARAARDPLLRLFWSAEFHTRGHLAERKSRSSGALKATAWVSILLFAAAFFAGDESTLPTSDRLTVLLLVTGFWFAVIYLFFWLTSFRSDSNMHEATEIFEILGFADPANVNLPKGHRRSDKRYAAESGEAREWFCNPMRFRYDACDLAAGAARISGN
ncbi:hypothetical protein [Massilia sp. S19_KUP03_FR1]|uniref:hypothetical protein n=1 Tax=Massilia sp. S19_KUP03_FR1 TaxID=3025503 RepID=UPI002FCD78C4